MFKTLKIFLICYLIASNTFVLTFSSSRVKFGRKKENVLKNSKKFQKKAKLSLGLKSHHHLKSKIAFTMVLKLVTLGLNIITGVINFFLTKQQLAIKELQDKVIKELVAFNEDTYREKQTLCVSIKASNAFYNEFYDWLRIENFMRRNIVYSLFQSNSKNFVDSHGHLLGKGCNSQVENERCASLYKQINAYDDFEINMAEAKYHLHEGEDTICNLSADVVGELSYFKGRSGGILTAMNPKESASKKNIGRFMSVLNFSFTLIGVVQVSEAIAAAKLDTVEANLNSFHERFKEMADTPTYQATYSELTESLNNQMLQSKDNLYDDTISYYVKSQIQGENNYQLPDVLLLVSANPFGTSLDSIVNGVKQLKKDVSVLYNWNSHNGYERAIAILNIVSYIFPLVFYLVHVIIFGYSAGAAMISRFYGAYPVNSFFINGIKMVIAILKVANVRSQILKEEEKDPLIAKKHDGHYISLRKEYEKVKSERKSAAWWMFFYFVMVFLPSGVYWILWKIIKKYSNPKKLITTLLKNIFNQIFIVMTIINFVLAIVNLIVSVIKLVLAIIHRKKMENEVEPDRKIRDNFKKHIRLQSIYVFIRYNSIVLHTLHSCMDYQTNEIQMWTRYMEHSNRKSHFSKDLKSLVEKDLEVERKDSFTDSYDWTVESENKGKIDIKKFFPEEEKHSVRDFKPKFSPMMEKKVLPSDFDEEPNVEMAFVNPENPLSHDFLESVRELKPQMDLNDFFMNICTENPSLCLKFWRYITMKVTNEEVLWKRINYILISGPIVKPFLMERMFFPAMKPLLDNYDFRIYKAEIFESESIMVYARSVYSIKFLSAVKVATRMKFPDVSEDGETVYSIQKELSAHGEKRVEFGVFRAHKNADVVESQDYIFLQYEDVRHSIDLWDVNVFNPILRPIPENTVPVAFNAINSFVGLHQEGNGKILQDLQGTLFYPTALTWGISGGNKKEFVSDPLLEYSAFGGYFDYECVDNESCPTCRKLEFYADYCLDAENKAQLKTSNIWFCFESSISITEATANRIYISSPDKKCESFPQPLDLKIVSENYWDYLIQDNESPLSEQQGYSKVEEEGSDIDIISVQREYVQAVKESLILKTCQLYDEMSLYKKEDLVKPFPEQIHQCFTNPAQFSQYYVIEQDNSFYKEFYQNSRDALIGKQVIALSEGLFNANEIQLNDSLLSIKDFKLHFDSTLRKLCATDYPDSIDWIGTGILYHHPFKLQEASIKKAFSEHFKSEIFTLKGKHLFNIGNNNKCFNNHVLKNRFRVLIPMKKEEELNNFFFRLYKQHSQTIDKVKRETFVYELIEYSEFNFDGREINIDIEGEEKKKSKKIEKILMSKKATPSNKLHKRARFQSKEVKKEKKEDSKKSKSLLASKRHKKKGGDEEDELELEKSNIESDSEDEEFVHRKLIRAKSYRPIDFEPYIDLIRRERESKESNFQTLNFAPIYKFFYLELWINKMRHNDSTDLMYVDNDQIKSMIDNCFVPFWPKTLRDYESKTEKDIEEESNYIPDADPTSDLFTSFYYNTGIIYSESISARLWVKYNYDYAMSKELMEKEHESSCAELIQKHENDLEAESQYSLYRGESIKSGLSDERKMRRRKLVIKKLN